LGWKNKKTLAMMMRRTKMKRNRLFDEQLAKVPEETKRMVEKQMTCKWLRNGDECSKGLPGTPCIVKGYVAWKHYREDEI
jgi:hypothetical protein